MLILATLLIFSLPACPKGVRSVVEDTTSIPQLRIHAVTFNAGNRVFKDEDPAFNNLLSHILPGHETMGDEADIVLLGFQEFEDNKYAMGNEIRSKRLWNTLTQRNVDALQQQVHDLFFQQPEEVRKSQDAILAKIRSKHRNVEAHFTRLQNHFQETNQHLDTQSPESKSQLEKLRTAVNSFGYIIDGIPITGTKELLTPMRMWRDYIKDHLAKIRSGFPNLNLSPFAETSWKVFWRNFMESTGKLDEQRVTVRTFWREQFLTDVKRMTNNIELLQNLGSTSKQRLPTWDFIRQHFSILQDHIANLTADGKSEMSTLKQSGALLHLHSVTVEKTLQQWISNINVQMEPQKFNSGPFCQGLEHLDTVLYAYVSPWSKWKIHPVDYSRESTERCAMREQKSQRNMGCNIDNNKKQECGKVVNFLVFRIEHAGVVKRLCALNTHMSYAGSAEHRINLIEQAMLEAQNAQCQSVVFLGDFNTRMHCGSLAEQYYFGKIPPFARSTESVSSLQHLLKKVCKDDSPESCSLKYSDQTTQSWDEMFQILNNDTVYCYEKKESKGYKKFLKQKKGYDLQKIKNPVKGMRLREVDVPEFPPTYKLTDPKKFEGLSHDWYHCDKYKLYESCFVNKDGKPKHNPAWTDRILVKANQFVTNEYSRRMITPKFGSDHAPVVARFSIDFNY